jgi:hypothetical protein
LNSDAAALFPAIPLQSGSTASEMKRETDHNMRLAIFVTVATIAAGWIWL